MTNDMIVSVPSPREAGRGRGEGPPNMSYRVRHLTEYMYSGAVSTSHHELHLLPRETPGQIVRDAALAVTPEPSLRRDRVDWFGNPSTHLAIHARHTRLAVISTFVVDIARERPPGHRQLGEGARLGACGRRSGGARRARDGAAIAARRPVAGGASVRRAVVHAGPSPRGGGPRSDAPDSYRVQVRHGRDRRRDVRRRGAARPARRLPGLRARHARRVCARFGLAARYVSGYLVTNPPPTRRTLVGADASHAWVSVRLPGGAWLDLDPTNDVIPTDRHIEIAHGRDFGDVTPMRGVLLGGGRHELIVGVDVAPISSEPEDG